jgi:hypothetical protein
MVLQAPAHTAADPNSAQDASSEHSLEQTPHRQLRLPQSESLSHSSSQCVLLSVPSTVFPHEAAVIIVPKTTTEMATPRSSFIAIAFSSAAPKKNKSQESSSATSSV